MAKPHKINVREYLVGLGIPALIFAICFSMTGFMNFWAGVLGASLAIVWFAVDWYVLSRGMRLIVRGTGGLSALAAAIFVGWIAFRPAPINVAIDAPPGNYNEGTNALGVLWKVGYDPVNIIVFNNTSSEYEGFDSYVRTSLQIAEVGVRGYINQCIATAENPFVTIGSASLSYNNAKGGTLSIPLFQGPQPIVSTFYRIRCDKLASNSKIDIVLAVVGALAGATEARPSWAVLSSRYTRAGKVYKAFDSHCFFGTCADMPNSYEGAAK